MKRFLIIGADTVVGANVAATLAQRHHVVTWAREPGYEFPDCQALDPADAPRKIIADAQPDHLIYCGPAAHSSWETGAVEQIDDGCVEEAQTWASEAQQAGVPLVMISSDAVFTGPWMFHDEQSPGFCTSFQAQTIRTAETQVQELHPQSLIIRTNALGWSPKTEGGWIENLLEQVQQDRCLTEDHVRHATPILATDLADILERACLENLTGLFHVAGAERVSPMKFTQRLSNQFDFPWLSIRHEPALNEPPKGFGEGECSLQTKEIRKTLCVAMPLLSESLSRLQEQNQNGFRDRLRCQPVPQQLRKSA